MNIHIHIVNICKVLNFNLRIAAIYMMFKVSVAQQQTLPKAIPIG